MTLRTRILCALAVVLAIATSQWCYLGWPRWFGAEIRMPVRYGARGGPSGPVVPYYPEFHLQLDAPNTMETGRPATSPTVHVRSIGVVWDPQRPAQAAASALRSRTAYLQLKAPADGGDGFSHVESISLSPVTGATNLLVQVHEVSSDGVIRVGIDEDTIPPGAGAGKTAVIIRVLPSGRATIVGVR